jgi:hypothetical protein
MELTLIVDYFTTCESKDEILELVDHVSMIWVEANPP